MSTDNDRPTALWDIPPSWAWSSTGEIADVIGGGTPRTSDAENFTGGQVPWITPADLSGYSHKLIEKGSRNITQRGLANSGARLMPKGTVLFSSRAPIGYVAIAANAVSTNQGFKSFVLPQEVSSDYLYYYLKAAKEVAVSLASGTTFLEISGAKAAQIPFPLAPKNEQQRIVDEIEKQFTRLDAAVAALKRVQTNLKRYRAAVLKAACEGRVVPTEAELARKEGRSYETGEQLLARILKERRTKWEADQLAKIRASGKSIESDDWKKKYKEPTSPDTSSLPQLPKGWVWANIEQVSQLVQYGSSAKCQAVGDIPVLRMGNITIDGQVVSDELKFLPKNHDEFPELLLRSGDLLFNRTNSAELVGKSAIYLGSPSPCSFASYLIRVVLVPGCEPRFVTCCLNSSYGRAWIKSVVNQQVGQANVNGTKLQAFAFPLPPSHEQGRIIAAIDQAFSNSQAAQTAVLTDLTRADRLCQSILNRAFEGKLVPQDPNDEPASALLERIRAERSAVRGKSGNHPRRRQKGALATAVK